MANWYGTAQLGLKRDRGRRWSMAQSFALGGTPAEIVERAMRFHEQRCEELGHALNPSLESFKREYYHLKRGFYTRLLEGAGWAVSVRNGRYVAARE